MKCPRCGSQNTKTIDSRPTEVSRRRIHECNSCGFRYRTYEIMESDFERMRELLGECKDAD